MITTAADRQTPKGSKCLLENDKMIRVTTLRPMIFRSMRWLLDEHTLRTRHCAEHAPKNRIDVLQVIAEVEQRFQRRHW